MTRDFLITAPANKVSGADFARSLGLNIRTKEQKAAEWQADCERYADMIERGGEWAVPPPCLWDARRIVQERAKRADLDPKELPDGSFQVAA
jgi:hypothetical protein